MDKKLKGKVAVVTGASKGIGASIAEHLADAGASVVVNYATSKEGAQKVVDKITKNGGKAVAIQADMSNEADTKRLFKETKKKFGHVDILINNAGVYEFKPLEEITTEHFRKLFDLNVLGLLFASREAVKYFGKDGGSILNISSVAATGSLPNSSVYSATKASVNAITKILAHELGPKKIRVNAVNPGMVITEGVKSSGIEGSELQKNAERTSAVGRVGIPEDVSPAVVFLSSDDASWISGETLYISGGYR